MTDNGALLSPKVIRSLHYVELHIMETAMMMIGYDLETTEGGEVIGAIYNTIHAMRPAF
jgi:hypothetical protein